MRFLRSAQARIVYNGQTLNLAGVDYQRMGTAYLTGAETLVREEAFNILLSHNPDVFDDAHRLGFDLTIAGHTHGGQVTVEILHQYANISRFFTPYVYGLYTKQRASSLYVSRGLGTVGIPTRIGAPPEVSLLKLCAG
jgi:hypothetical protein